MAFAALVTAAVGVLWPAVVAWPAAALAAWIGLAWLGKAWKLRHDHEGPEGAAALAEVVPEDRSGRLPTARHPMRESRDGHWTKVAKSPDQSL